MEKENIISIWLGNFATEEEFFEYLEFFYDEEDNPFSEFMKDFRIEYYDEDFQEAIFSSSLAHETKELSYVDSFKMHLKNLDLIDYNALICLYDFEYHSLISKAKMKFIGSYYYSKN